MEPFCPIGLGERAVGTLQPYWPGREAVGTLQPYWSGREGSWNRSVLLTWVREQLEPCSPIGLGERAVGTVLPY